MFEYRIYVLCNPQRAPSSPNQKPIKNLLAQTFLATELAIYWMLHLLIAPTTAKIAKATTVAYTSFFSEAAWSEDMLLAYASVLPCQRLYDWLFSTIHRREHISDENPYKEFITQFLGFGKSI